MEHGGDHIAPLAFPVVAAKGAKIGEEAGAMRSIGAFRMLGGKKGEEVRSGDALRAGGPVTPTVGRLDDRAIALPSKRRALFLDAFHVIEEFQEHDPSQHGQAVEITVQALVLAHDPARGLDNAVEALSRGHLLLRGLFSGGSWQSSLLRIKRKAETASRRPRGAMPCSRRSGPRARSRCPTR